MGLYQPTFSEVRDLAIYTNETRVLLAGEEGAQGTEPTQITETPCTTSISSFPLPDPF